MTEQLQLEQNFLDTLGIIDRQYLNSNSYQIVNLDKNAQLVDLDTSVRFLQLEKFVYEKDVKIIDKLSSVYSALYSEESTVILKLYSDGKECKLYIGVNKANEVDQSFEVLKGAVEGNFPGSTFVKNSGLKGSEIKNLNDDIFNEQLAEATAVLGVPSLKNKIEDSFIQGIENLIIGMQGKSFSAIFIADPIQISEIEEAKSFYEAVYSNLSSLKEQTYNLGTNVSHSVTTGITETLGDTFTKSNSKSNSESESIGNSKGRNTSNSKTPGIGKALINKIFGSDNKMSGTNISKTTTHSTSVTESISDSLAKMKSTAINEGNTNTVGTSSSVQFTVENKIVSNALEKLDLLFERLKNGESLGLWSYGAYFLSAEMQNSVVAANIYNGIIKGEDTRVEKSVVRKFKKGSEDFELLLSNIKNYEIPTISLFDYDYQNRLASVITTNELSIAMSLPHKSVIGVDVVEVSPFGNNIKQVDKVKSITVGQLFNYEKKFDVDFNLDIEKFTGHVFVTGSTGSGKSNATYTILKQLIRKEIKFMVIEPAKGEYKDVFKDVSVFGTNPDMSQLLRLNPFSFPNQIHIYEHIDRLTEILNACWSMEAAMPAFLKEAIEQVYISKGWDLESSKNLIQDRCFPTFKDLAELMPSLIEKSAFSQEVKGNYTGALVTRVKSLTNGLVKLIFAENEIPASELFEKNVIVDLSRVASSETKSLLMGVLFMKLHEHRISEKTENNSSLKHVAIIEEAHNLIKNTNSTQSNESANLQGKSVEMISNAIAEMRTYGQGFILADQAPGLLDPSAIRNTNTKICLRLPSEDDRKLVGKAMNLTDDQINELAKLKMGIAAIYQNDWQEAILCQFNKFEDSEGAFEYKSKEAVEMRIIRFLVKQLVSRRIGKDIKLADLEKISKGKYANLVNQIKTGNLSENEIAKMLFELLQINTVLEIAKSNANASSVSSFNRLFFKLLVKKWSFEPESKETKEVFDLILKHCASIDTNIFSLYKFNRDKLKFSN